MVYVSQTYYEECKIFTTFKNNTKKQPSKKFLACAKLFWASEVHSFSSNWVYLRRTAFCLFVFVLFCFVFYAMIEVRKHPKLLSARPFHTRCLIDIIISLKEKKLWASSPSSFLPDPSQETLSFSVSCHLLLGEE